MALRLKWPSSGSTRHVIFIQPLSPAKIAQICKVVCTRILRNVLCYFTVELEDAARYAGQLLAPAEGFGLRPRLIMLFWPILGHFWCPVVTLVICSSNHSNFEKNP